MIECSLGWNSGWGNEVIQHCFSRCLGSELDYYVESPKIRHVKNSGNWNLDGKRFDEPVYEITTGNHKHKTDLEFFKSQGDCKFIIKSFLEYYPVFEKYTDNIKNDWMYMDQPFSRDNLGNLKFKKINWDSQEVKKGKRFDDKYYTDVNATKHDDYLRYPDNWYYMDENGHRPASSMPFKVGDNRFVEVSTPVIHEEDIVLNIRLGPDYTYGQFRPRRILSDYFDNLLRNIHFRSVFIASEWPFHEILQPLYKYDPIFLVHDEPPEINTFNFVRLFDKMVISQSSWCWMLSFLSESKEVYFPITKDGPWSYGPNQNPMWKDEGHDLMVNEDRYIYVDHTGEIIGNYAETREKLSL